MTEIKIPWKSTAIFLVASFVIAIGEMIKANVLSMRGDISINLTLGVISICILSILCVSYSTERTLNDFSTKMFFCLIILTYFGLITDNFSRVLDGNIDLLWLNGGLSFFSYIVYAISAPVFLLYQRSIYQIEITNSKLVFWLWRFTILDVLYLIVANYFGWIFYFDEKGAFHTNFGHNLSMIYPVLVGVICIVNNAHLKVEARKHIALLTFNFTLLFGLLLAYFTGLAILYTAATMSLLLMYLSLQMERSIELTNRDKIIAEQNEELVKKQTQIMMSQMQPHFIYNALATIYYLCGKNTDLARKTIMDFSEYLRTNMASLQNNPMISFEKELEHTKTYLSIELLRFADILNVEYNISYKDFMIPALSLQPIVENAVKYGVRSRKDGGTITISTKLEENFVFITVHDNGRGFDTTGVENDGRQHLGIENTKRRIELMCNGKLEVESSIEKGTTVTIVMESKHEPAISR